MASRIRYAGLIALAVVMAAWFVLLLRQSHDADRAAALVSGGSRLTATRARRAAEDLRSSAQLNPDRQVDVLRAELYRDQGQLRSARAVLKRVVAAEPENLEAWIWLARSSPGDPVDFYAAAYRIRQLVRALPSR
jgi:predicted Zn-dependent protease